MKKEKGCLVLVSQRDMELLRTDPNLFWEGVTSIGEHAFESITFPDELIIPNSVKEIKDWAFADSFLKKVTLPGKLEKLGSETFYEASELEEIIIQEGVESLPKNFCSNCERLKKVVLPRSLKELGERAFKSCNKIEEIDLSNVEKIGESCFDSCKKLKNVVLSKNLQSIGEYSFYFCKRLEKVVIDGIDEIPNGAFSGCKELKEIIFNKPVKKIGVFAFKLNEKLTEINLPEGLEKIELGAFQESSQLKKVALPNGLKEIGNYAFKDCLSLEEVIIPDTVETIGDSAYEESGVVKVTLPKSLKVIPDGCFEKTKKLKEVVAFEGLKEICEAAFYGSGIENFNMPNSVEKLGDGAFRYCLKLKNINLSKNLKELPAAAFSECRALEQIEIPESVETVGSKLFLNCNSLVKADLPNSVKEIGTRIYANCFSLKEVNLPNKITEISDFMFASSGLEKLKIGNNIKEMGEDCLSMCNDLKELTIPLSLEKMNSVSMPNEVKTFVECRNGKVEMSNEIFVQSLGKENLNSIREFASKKIERKKFFMPSQQVWLNTPKDLVENFYTYSKDWARLINKFANSVDKTPSEINEESKADFFKLCLVSGIFSNSKFEREKANEFIETKIIGRSSEAKIHERFNGLKTVENGYNPFFAKFLIRNFDDNFLKIEIGTDSYANYIAEAYNRFNQIEEVFGINSRKRVNQLNSKNVIEFLFLKKYNYKKGTSEEKLANLCGMYGYSVEGFEKLKSWVHEGEKIKAEGIENLFCKPDYVTSKDVVTYEFLEKGDPVGAVLGNITNCCQKLDGAGESCCKHGLTNPNGGFIVFKLNDKIVGQSWVWFNENGQKVCLDNVEVPHAHEKIVLNDEVRFNDCLKRVRQGFVDGMKERNRKVIYVTMGVGFNDVISVAEKEFKTTKVVCALAQPAVQTDKMVFDNIFGGAPTSYTDITGGELVL